LRGEGAEKNKEPDTRTFYYCKCPTCKVKLHVYAASCWKCGEKRERQIYHSHDQEDALYSKNMNSVEKCMGCYSVLQRGIICETIYCFGTGRGSCEYCRRTNGIRFECCQQVQKEGPKQGSYSEALKEIIKDKIPGPLSKSLTEAIEQPQFDDEIPF